MHSIWTDFAEVDDYILPDDYGNWINLVSTLVRTVSYSIRVNGKNSSVFRPGRG